VENFVGRKFYGIEEDQTAIDGNRKSKRRAKSRDTEETGETAQGVFDRRWLAGGAIYHRVSQGTRRQLSLSLLPSTKENIMATTTATQAQTNTAAGSGQADMAESMIRTIDESTIEATNISLFHILTLGSIGASLALFFAGKKQAGIFVGLWPPTFQALKAVADTNKNKGK